MFSAFLKGAFCQLLTCLPMKRPKHLIMLNGAQSTILLRLGDMALNTFFAMFSTCTLQCDISAIQTACPLAPGADSTVYVSRYLSAF